MQLKGRAILHLRSWEPVKRKSQKQIDKWFRAKWLQALRNGRHYHQTWVEVSIGATLTKRVSRRAATAATKALREIRAYGHQVIKEPYRCGKYSSVSVIILDIQVEKDKQKKVE